jgi:hypothetical protein
VGSRELVSDVEVVDWVGDKIYVGGVTRGGGRLPRTAWAGMRDGVPVFSCPGFLLSGCINPRARLSAPSVVQHAAPAVRFLSELITRLSAETQLSVSVFHRIGPLRFKFATQRCYPACRCVRMWNRGDSRLSIEIGQDRDPSNKFVTVAVQRLAQADCEENGAIYRDADFCLSVRNTRCVFQAANNPRAPVRVSDWKIVSNSARLESRPRLKLIVPSATEMKSQTGRCWSYQGQRGL